jgi:hypothetical protein
VLDHTSPPNIDRQIALGEQRAPRFGLYLILLAAGIACCLVTISMLAMLHRNHFASIAPADLDPEEWYQNTGGKRVMEIQDEDVFYHGIGSSIANLRRADVVIMGSSIVAFAINGRVAGDLMAQHGLKFFNMSFIGVFSGAFPRLIIKKYQLHPKLWIINADDGGGGGNFFSHDLTRGFSGDVRPIPVLQYGRTKAIAEVIRRNLRWRLEDAPDDISLLLSGTANRRSRSYRSASTGNAEFRNFPQYERSDNGPVEIKRAPDCHTNAQAIEIARDFVRDIGGSVILTVIPNFWYCETQAREIADSLGIEFVSPGHLDYSSWDGGGHLDRRGSLRLTADLMGAIERSQTFARLFPAGSPER